MRPLFCSITRSASGLSVVKTRTTPSAAPFATAKSEPTSTSVRQRATFRSSDEHIVVEQ
jgi:hypothetical protein